MFLVVETCKTLSSSGVPGGLPGGVAAESRIAMGGGGKATKNVLGRKNVCVLRSWIEGRGV